MAVRLGKGYVELGVNAKALRGGLARARGALRGFARASVSALRRLSRLPMMLGVAGIGGAVAYAVKKFGDFEQAMARVKAISGATGSAFFDLRNKAMQLGRTTRFTAMQSAEAMSQFALAGFKADEIIGAMPATLNLAAAGQLDMATAAGITSKTMRAMGLQAQDLDHVVNVLVGAFTTANTDLVQLGEALKYVAPVSKAAGISLEETIATIQLMSDAGIQATMAGTALRKIILTLQDPRAAKELRNIGVQTYTAAGKFRYFADIIRDMKRAFAGLDIDKRAEMIALFGMRAGPGLEAVLQRGSTVLDTYTQRLKNVGDIAKEISDVMENTLWGAFRKLASAVQGAAIEIGKRFEPALNRIAKWITKNIPAIEKRITRFIDNFRAFFSNIKKLWAPFKNWLLAEVDVVIAHIGEKMREMAFKNSGWIRKTFGIGAMMTKAIIVGPRPPRDVFGAAEHNAKLAADAFDRAFGEQRKKNWMADLKRRGGEEPGYTERESPSEAARKKAVRERTKQTRNRIAAVMAAAGRGRGGVGAIAAGGLPSMPQFTEGAEHIRAIQSAAMTDKKTALDLMREQRDLLKKQLAIAPQELKAQQAIGTEIKILVEEIKSRGGVPAIAG